MHFIVRFRLPWHEQSCRGGSRGGGDVSGIFWPIFPKLNCLNIYQNCQNIGICHAKLTRLVPQLDSLPSSSQSSRLTLHFLVLQSNHPFFKSWIPFFCQEYHNRSRAIHYFSPTWSCWSRQSDTTSSGWNSFLAAYLSVPLEGWHIKHFLQCWFNAGHCGNMASLYIQ